MTALHQFQGLNNEEVEQARKEFGSNSVDQKKTNNFLQALQALIKEPMVLLLLVTSSIYFIIGKAGDGIFLAFAIVLVAAISLFQDQRSRNALEKLKEYTQPRCKVIRNGEVQQISNEALVLGDVLMIEEGNMIAADAVILQSNDFSVNESILTGESLSIFKDAAASDPQVYQGTTVTTGLAITRITAIGLKTRLGKIGSSLDAIEDTPTPLEQQINQFVKKMVIAGAVVFLLVWAINFLHSKKFADSLLKALTLAMSILPEEIPVAFTTFMAIGAWRLMKMGILVKQMKTVETLGSATVICTDKTGTITENKMTLANVYLASSHQLISLEKQPWSEEVCVLIRMAMWASEPIPFDPMERALHEAYGQFCQIDERPS